MYRKCLKVLPILAAFFLLAGCGTTTTTKVPSKTSALKPTSIPATPTLSVEESLSILDVNDFTQQEGSYKGQYHVVGLIKNISHQRITTVSLDIKIYDADKNLIKENKNCFINNDALFPDEIGSFDCIFGTLKSTPASHDIVIKPFLVSGNNYTPTTIEIQNTKFYNGGDGFLYLSGELVNKQSQWVYGESLSAAVFDSSDHILSAAKSFDAANGSLAPSGDSQSRDRSPFLIKIADPGSGVNDWHIYTSYALGETPASSLDIQVTNFYFDKIDIHYVVGWIINNSSLGMSTSSGAGFYDKDGVVLDAAWSSPPILVPAGGQMPFFVKLFHINRQTITTLDHIKGFIPYWMTEPVEIVTLAASDEIIEKKSDIFSFEWKFTGNIKNTDTKTLSVYATVAIFDAQGKLTATSYKYVGMIKPGETDQYDVTVPLDPDSDVTGYTSKTTIQGKK
jgi:hypothetical protein